MDTIRGAYDRSLSGRPDRSNLLLIFDSCNFRRRRRNPKATTSHTPQADAEGFLLRTISRDLFAFERRRLNRIAARPALIGIGLGHVDPHSSAREDCHFHINDAIRNGAQMHEVRQHAGHSSIHDGALFRSPGRRYRAGGAEDSDPRQAQAVVSGPAPLSHRQFAWIDTWPGTLPDGTLVATKHGAGLVRRQFRAFASSNGFYEAFEPALPVHWRRPLLDCIAKPT